MKKVLINILRSVISFGLLAYLIYQADIHKIYDTLNSADYCFFLLALLVFLLSLLLFAVRWQILLKQLDIRPGYIRLLIYYFIGYFLNNFLPTTIGGDVSRAYNVAKISRNRAASFGTVLLERIMGVLATLTLASFSMFWAIRYFNTYLIIIITTSLLAFVVFTLVNLLNPALFKITSSILGKVKILGVGEKINKVLLTIHSYREAKASIFYAYLISLCCQVMLIVMNYVLALALGLDQVTLGYLFLVVPVTFVMGLIPSINGLGVRDYGYKELLTRIGLNSAEALSVSFLNTLVMLLMSLIGGLFMIFYRNDVASVTADSLETPLD